MPMSPTADRVDGSLDLRPAGDASPTVVAEAFPRNEVRLTGRISAIGEPSTLPSGDVVVNLRLVVPREHPVGRRSPTRDRPGDGDAGTDPKAGARSPGVDTIDVACWTPATQRAAGRVGVDGMAEVTGVLRRRFFRAGGGPSSRYEVEATRIRRVREDAGIRGTANASSDRSRRRNPRPQADTTDASASGKSAPVESLTTQ